MNAPTCALYRIRERRSITSQVIASLHRDEVLLEHEQTRDVITSKSSGQAAAALATRAP
jgi:hypothetical protein